MRTVRSGFFLGLCPLPGWLIKVLRTDNAITVVCDIAMKSGTCVICEKVKLSEQRTTKNSISLFPPLKRSFLLPKFDELSALLTTIDVDLMAVTETCLKEDVPKDPTPWCVWCGVLLWWFVCVWSVMVCSSI